MFTYETRCCQAVTTQHVNIYVYTPALLHSESDQEDFVRSMMDSASFQLYQVMH